MFDTIVNFFDRLSERYFDVHYLCGKPGTFALLNFVQPNGASRRFQNFGVLHWVTSPSPSHNFSCTLSACTCTRVLPYSVQRLQYFVLLLGSQRERDQGKGKMSSVLDEEQSCPRFDENVQTVSQKRNRNEIEKGQTFA